MQESLEAFRLGGRVAVITGAASGIGRAAAVLFADVGARCLLADVDRAGLEETARVIGPAASVHPLDVAEKGAVDDLARRAMVDCGRLDVWANVAGITGPSPMLDLTEELVDRLIAINLKGVLWGALAAGKAMKEQGRGSIINISSTGAINAPPMQSIYSITKAGVNALTRNLSKEIGAFGVRVNTISPGWVDTPLGGARFRRADGSVDPAGRAQTIEIMKAASALGTTGEPIDIAQAMLYLASDASRFMTGQNLFVNGGVTLA